MKLRSNLPVRPNPGATNTKEAFLWLYSAIALMGSLVKGSLSIKKILHPFQISQEMLRNVVVSGFVKNGQEYATLIKQDVK